MLRVLQELEKKNSATVTQRGSPWPSVLRLELLVPAPVPVPPVAAPVLPPSGGDSG